MSGLSVSTPPNNEPINLFANWQNRYPRIYCASHDWRKIWQAIPRFFWWKIWLARNDLIFNSKAKKPELVAITAKALLLEVVGNHLDLKELSVEHNWLGLSQVDKIQLNSGRPVINPFWQVRNSEKYFSGWWQKKNKV